MCDNSTNYHHPDKTEDRLQTRLGYENIRNKKGKSLCHPDISCLHPRQELLHTPILIRRSRAYLYTDNNDTVKENQTRKPKHRTKVYITNDSQVGQDNKYFLPSDSFVSDQHSQLLLGQDNQHS